MSPYVCENSFDLMALLKGFEEPPGLPAQSGIAIMSELGFDSKFF